MYISFVNVNKLELKLELRPDYLIDFTVYFTCFASMCLLQKILSNIKLQHWSLLSFSELQKEMYQLTYSFLELSICFQGFILG